MTATGVRFVKYIIVRESESRMDKLKNLLKMNLKWVVDNDSLSIKCNKQSVVVAGIVSPYEFSSYSLKEQKKY